MMRLMFAVGSAKKWVAVHDEDVGACARSYAPDLSSRSRMSFSRRLDGNARWASRLAECACYPLFDGGMRFVAQPTWRGLVIRSVPIRETGRCGLVRENVVSRGGLLSDKAAR